MSLKRLSVLLLAGVIGATIVVGLYWHYRLAPRWAFINRETNSEAGERAPIESTLDAQADFDLTVDLPGDPLGLAIKDGRFIIGNRKDPWGFLRITQEGDGYMAQKIPVIEPTYNQKVGFTTITWNGKNFVGYADGTYYRAPSKYVFTIHDPETLQVIKHYPAPDLIGGLAWDGSGYWAATRRNTEDSNEPAFLYHLDGEFKEVGRTEPPAVGCQGLAWDGSHLWFVDVFADAIYLLDVTTSPARTIHTYQPHLSYLSGIGYDGSHVWITEYSSNKLHRINPALMSAWHDRESSVDLSNQIAEALSSLPAEEPEVQAEESSSKTAKTTDRYESLDSEPYAEDKATVVNFEASAESGSIRGSWNIYFGRDFFEDHGTNEESRTISMPTFAKYRFTVTGESLNQNVVHEYDADAGENTAQDEALAENLEPGVYSVGLFIHVQYIDAEGTNRIVNDTSPSLEVQVLE